MVTDTSARTKEPILQCIGLTKRFGGLVAVNNVSLEVFPGEVVGLVGDNGAGKSTLIHLISGVYHPDEGQMILNGEDVRFSSPMDARQRGIETIFQDLALCNNLSACDNIFLGRERLRKVFGLFNVLDRAQMKKEAETILKELDIVIPGLQRPIRQLSGGQRQAVAISRSVYWNAKLLIMDEPTAALGVPEQRKVKELVCKLKERHVPVIIISHNMQEVFSVADRVIVMRRGFKVADLVAKDTDSEQVITHIVGKEESPTN